MKNIIASLLMLGVFSATMSSFSDIERGSIKGMISPVNAGKRVVAMSQSDTVSSVIYQGMFHIKNMRPGTYSLTVEASLPYKNGYKSLIVVADGEATDIGYIFLKK